MVASPEPALDHAISPPRRRTRSAARAKAAQQHDPEQPRLQAPPPPQQQQQQQQKVKQDATVAPQQQLAPGKRSKVITATSKAVRRQAPAAAEDTGAEAADGEQAATDAHVLELVCEDEDQPRPFKQARKVCWNCCVGLAMGGVGSQQGPLASVHRQLLFVVPLMQQCRVCAQLNWGEELPFHLDAGCQGQAGGRPYTRAGGQPASRGALAATPNSVAASNKAALQHCLHNRCSTPYSGTLSCPALFLHPGLQECCRHG